MTAFRAYSLAMAPDDVPAQDSPQPLESPPFVSSATPPSAVEVALLRRVSDQEREDVAELLREAAGEGRLSYTELEERLDTTYGAKTYGDLVEVTADLPHGLRAPSVPGAQAMPSQPAPVIHAFLSESKRTGPWLAPQRQEVNAVLGDVTLDYTEAQLPFDEVWVDVRSILADVKIRVPQNAVVHLDSNPILGSVSEQSSGVRGAVEPAAGPPKVFHIRGTAILGEIKVKRGPRLAKRLGLA